MGYYVIHGDCNGCNYYLKTEYNGNRKVPSFTWFGIKNNASRFLNKNAAEAILKKVKPFSKLPMRVVNY